MSCEITRARKKRPIYQLGDRINAPFVNRKKKQIIVAVIIIVVIIIGIAREGEIFPR